ncbi:MAG: AAA family ATPase [Thermotogota bacterium]
MKRLPIGISDFKELIENDYLFADTTPLIGEIYREQSKILLITRPRRFGKTLNMSMLRYFFDNTCQNDKLFLGLDITRDDEVMAQINTYPVIFLSFKDIKNNSWEDSFENLKWLISKLYKDIQSIVEKNLTSQDDILYYNSIIKRTASEVDYQNALKNLIDYLKMASNKNIILLIDEYDVPIQSGWSNGFYDEIIDFMRVFLSAALKDNPNLFKGVLTGIYRVAKESIFSGLNNLKAFTIMDNKYTNYFGFTETEIESILKSMNLQSVEEIKIGLREWYNGYRMGNHIIYNPWSVINYLYDHILKPYWINTSSNDLIISLVEKNMLERDSFREEIELLLSGNSIEKPIDEASALRDIENNPDAIWTLFLFSGYITTLEKVESDFGVDEVYACSIPNKEVTRFFRKTVLQWLKKADRITIDRMAQNLINGNGEKCCESLKAYVRETLSYFDLKQEVENSYHMLLLGIFAQLQDSYIIRSNRESGLGRPDILLKAKDKKHYSAVIELKADSSQKALEEAMRQIEEKDYVRKLESEGYTRILKVALGVDGKSVEGKVLG